MPAIAFYVKLPIDMDTESMFLDALEECGFVGAVWPTILRIGRERNRNGVIEAGALLAKTVCHRIPLASSYRQQVQDSIDAFVRSGMLVQTPTGFVIPKWVELYGDSRKANAGERKRLTTIDDDCTQSTAIDSNCGEGEQCSARVEQSRVEQNRTEEIRTEQQASPPPADAAPVDKAATKAIDTDKLVADWNAFAKGRPATGCRKWSPTLQAALNGRAKDEGGLEQFNHAWDQLMAYLPHDGWVSGDDRPAGGWKPDLAYLLTPKAWTKLTGLSAEFAAAGGAEDEAARMAREGYYYAPIAPKLTPEEEAEDKARRAHQADKIAELRRRLEGNFKRYDDPTATMDLPL